MRLIDRSIMEQLFHEASCSERKRAHYLLHTSHHDKVQRLIITLVKGSFVEPHYHELAHQWEMFVVSEGCIEVKTYADDGQVKSSFRAGPKEEISIVEFVPGDIHSVECLSERAVMIEVKEGPFDPNYAKTSPDWV